MEKSSNVYFQKTSILSPPPPHGSDWTFWGMGGGGGSKAQEFREGGRGGCLNEFFSQTSLNFHTAVHKVLLFAFCFQSSKCKKINLANLKVRLDILSQLESNHR